MYWSKKDIINTPTIERLNLINSITGVKPANLIASISKTGISNVAIFSSIVHLGSNPALLGFLFRPQHEVRRDTYQNIMDNKFYTINRIHSEFIEQAHYTSAKFDNTESEFEKCQLTEEYLEKFPVPYVKQSKIKLGMKLEDVLPISINNCIMIIGSIQHLFIDKNFLNENGHIDLEKSNEVGIGGLNSYYKLKKIGQFPYARVHQLPSFTSKKMT